MSFYHAIKWSIEAAWVAFCAYWFIMAFGVKRAVKRQSLSSRVLHITVGVLAYMLLFTDRFSWEPLAWRFIPDSRAWATAGALVTWAGVALAIWARTILGRNWSATVTVKQDHTLVRNGPYSTVRHPIYSGLLLAGLGTALAIGEVHSLLAVVIGLVGFRVKSTLEERFMIEQFGREYEEYQRHSWALVPFVL
ncbi:MAG TPA: isoprenylcysteine carboxylmethyltransferase family protein [Terriglobia bacterium]|nr:isoprenylcysteine carboxylmethyltransferase family protein [Terriglobia bacterium]